MTTDSAGVEWLLRLVTATGWDAEQTLQVDWTSAEDRVGSRLPGDYKRLIEWFGKGTFDDGYVDLHVPDDLAAWTQFHADTGVLPWASNEQEMLFCWITDEAAPEAWPVCVMGVGDDDGDRFDCTATELMVRMLTEPQHPYTIPADYSSRWFVSFGDAYRLAPSGL
ncbi:hypothetical protein PUR71_09980 [Streptomyces sp. SP17BM10]|uniref:hypothetical protein n=1 Tax=Streptomyces sp. SP17BM10 TaxID=3002530 RepID=UPI002E7651D1|nr:hypothetical protein [Streptomyces sp. SP17BM10]MEE1783239.1 hypothetical protein [Streptomyces sp. SP17BM10]